MKLNKILMAIAATAIVGCTSDDLNELSTKQAVEDSRLIELNENFVLSGVGVEGVATRTHWEQDATTKALKNKFLPIYNGSAAAGNKLNLSAKLEAQAVGLCWLGETTGADVYTNYQFYHFGWLKKDEAKAIVECDKLTNGVFYDEITLAADGTENAEAVETNFKLPSAPVDKTGWTLNYNSGVYKTDNKAIFGGKYIVYYPFNKDFNEVGTIPAKASTSFSPVPTDLNDPALGAATFRYSAPIEIKGGDQASDFGLHNLSALVQLKVTGNSDAKKIDQIVLWSKKEQLLEQANLAADKIVAGKKGTELYAETKGAKTIVAALGTAAAVSNTTPVNAYITALPTKVEDLVAYIHRVDGTWAKKELGEVEFKPNTGKLVTINVAAADFEKKFIAVDEATLNTALREAAGLTATIEVIGDIKLTANTTINEPNVTIKGDDIIVPEDVTLNVNTKMESDVRVLGKSCCSGAQGGRLVVNGGKLGNVTMEKAEATVTETNYDTYNPAVTYAGAATIDAGKTFDVKAGNVTVDAAVAHKGNINIAKGAKLLVSATGDLNFMGSTVVNDGTIEVKKEGKYDMTDANGNAKADDGLRMTNNGTFIHNVDAGVGTAVQSMKQNGEYRCKVDDQIKLDDALLQWKACSVIEMVNTSTLNYDLGKVCQHNGKYIDFEVNATGGTTFSNPTPDNKEINIGKLTVKSPFAIDYTNTVGTTTGKRTLTVNGDMAVTANTSIKDSKKINIKQNLTLDGAWIDFAGGKVNEDGLAVTGDITVSGAGKFSASDVDALNITCANFYLKSGAKAEFGNRTEGDAKNLVVSGTISNPATCTFDIKPATGGNVLAWVTCKKLEVGGTFSAARPRVE